MLLSLLRFTMIVPLLISAVCIEANGEKSKAVAEVRENDVFGKRDAISDHRRSDEHVSRPRGVGSLENRIPRSGDGNLARKMAKEALKSPKMQETMHKLTHGRSSHRQNKLFASVKVPGAPRRKSSADFKKHGRQTRLKGRQKKKRKRHHRRYGNQQPGWPRRGSSKRMLSTRRDINAFGKKLHGNSNKPVSKSNMKITAVKVDDTDYVDFSTPLNTQPSISLTKLHGSENMVERLMRTTTKDPSKRNGGDQGIEYSDYYSEDDVLQDLAANKIPIRAASLRNPNDRFTRQTVNSTSFYTDNQIDTNVQPYYQDYDAHSKDVIYSDDSVNNFPNDALGYRLPEYQNENLNMAYPVSTEGIPEEPDQDPNVSGLQNNGDDQNRQNYEIQQPVDQDQFNYANEGVEPQVANVEVPKFSNQFSLYDRPSAGTNLQLPGNLEPNTMNRPPAESMRLLQAKNDLPVVNVPNAMDQPLGKILESLGINANQNSNSNLENVNTVSVEKKLNNPLSFSETLDRPMERKLSPSYLKNPISRNENLGESYSRRQLTDNGILNNNLSPFDEGGKIKSHNVNISIAMHDTKEVAGQLLDTIMEELEEMKLDRGKNNKREGSWSTTQAGMKLDLKVVNHTITVTVSDLVSPRFHESLLNGTWNVTGHAPFKRGSPFTLIATDNHTSSLAVFVGACRVCQGIDTIAGVWSVARPPKDCRDFQVATSVFNDIFRKTKWSSLKEKEHSNGNATETTTAKNEKKRS
ncbi:uncharacterized protein LOC143349774 isoform X2 [Colletes latitarsis]|uniref:uncharacterized protein LOC143349774 isoform X2 n=1 Tax=Colletes latitarsis TaxID=2605962 RepID=UPI0040359905